MSSRVILSIWFFTLLVCPVFGQAVGQIISPQAGAVLQNGELFVVFKKNNRHRWTDYNFDVYVDRDDMTELAKTTGDMLTLLLTHPLRPGEHEITVHIALKGKPLEEFKRTFSIAGKVSPTQTSQPKFRLRANFEARSRITDLSGPGQRLRQEPPQLHTLNFRGSAFHNKVEFPFRLYVTNQDKSYLQWRNTYMLGIKTHRFALYGGDVFPNFHRHLINGSKIRGGRAYVRMKNTFLDVAYGNIQRGIEGALQQYDVALGFPPVNLEADGTFIEAGRYKREILSGRLLFKSKYSKDETALLFLRGKDIASSIEFGGPVGQNIVLGFSHKTTSDSGRLFFDFGLSGSMTTRDIRPGAISNAEIRELYDREAFINPKSIEPIFVINASTTPLRITGFPSISWYGILRLKVLQQNITLQHERVGGAFYSYGLPYLINDRLSFALSDKVDFWKRKVILTANYRYYKNNLSDEKTTTQQTGYLQSSLIIQLKPTWPQLILSYNGFQRKGKDVYANKEVLKRFVQTYSVGTYYSFKTGETMQGIQFSFSRNERLDKLRANNDFYTDALNARLNLEPLVGFKIMLEYQFLLLSNDTSDFNRQNGYGLRLQYRTLDKKFNFSAGARQFRTDETAFSPEANRKLFDVRMEYFIWKNLSLTLRAGRTVYDEAILNTRNYEEMWGEAGLRFRFR